MNKKRMAVLSCLMMAVTTLFAANQGQYDLQLVTVSSPGRSASQNQRVIVCPNNLGDSISGYTIGVIKDGNLLFEEQVERGLNRNEWRYDTLQSRVPMDYGATHALKVYVRINENDVDKTNDTISYDVNMPELTPYPMEWDATKWKASGLGWKYNESLDAFYTSGRKTNMLGSAGTVDVVNFPAGEMVTCKFDYQASITGTYSIILNYGDSTQTITGDMAQHSESYGTIQASFVAAGPAMVSLTGSLPLAWNGYGSIVMRNISFAPAILDVETTSIDSPLTDKLATDNSPITITATFTNVSPFDAGSLDVCYQVGDFKVTESVPGGLAAGQSVTHTFATPYQAQSATTATLSVWCQATGDGNLANDTLSRELKFYNAVAFPFVESFDAPDANWAMVDNNHDGHGWTFAQLTDGNGVAYYSRHSAAMDDYLITPAIEMPQGVARISFYYASLYGSGTAKLQVLMGKKPVVAEMTEVLFDEPLTNRGWLNGYHLLDLPEAGAYYFAFVANGTNDGIVLDRLYIDRGEDICIENISFDTQSGFNKGNSKVTISYKNHGVTAQQDIDVEYFINSLTSAPVHETATQMVLPGETATYTFEQSADLSTADSTYTLVGVIASKIGIDQINDSIVGQTVSHYANQLLPYYNDFTDVNRDLQWSFEPGNDGQTSWLIGSSFQALTNRICLAHNYVTTDTPADDWAFSECIEIPKGEYEMSFFYRTSLNWDTEQYVQNFAAHLGTEPSAEAMTTELFKFENGTVGRPAYRKFINTIAIPEDGKYYLGFHGYSPKNNGTTLIDCISLKPIEDGKVLTYASDFTNNPAEWTRYNYTAQFNRWEYSGNGVDSLFVVSRNNDNKYSNYEGLLVSPKLSVQGGRKVFVEVEYSLESDTDSVALCLYGSSIDDPDQMQVLTSSVSPTAMALSARLPQDGDYAVMTYQFTPEEDTDYFVGLRSNMQGNYDINVLYNIAVKQVKVYYEEVTGTYSLASGQTQIQANNGFVSVTSADLIGQVTLCDITGRCVETIQVGTHAVSLSTSHLSGVYIVNVTTDKGVVSKKVML